MTMDGDRNQAVGALADGGLRRTEAQAWRLFLSAWPIIERFVRVRLLTAGLHANSLEDCGQNVFTRVWRFRDTYRGSSEQEFWAWVRTICDNERRRIQSRDGRARAFTPAVPDTADDFDVVDPGNSPPTDAANRETHVALHGCLERLEAKHRRVVELIYFRPQLSERAAAEALDWSASNVHKVKAQALQKLRTCLERKGIE